MYGNAMKDDSYFTTLSHHGVKGMKWGVRNAETRSKYASQKKTGSATQKLQKAKKSLSKKMINIMYKDPIKRNRAKAMKNRRYLSDRELNDRIKRLEQEKRLKQLTQEDISPGRQAFKRVAAATIGAAGKAVGADAVRFVFAEVAEGKRPGNVNWAIETQELGKYVSKKLKTTKKK